MAFSLALTHAPELGRFPSPVRKLLVQRAISRLHAESKLATWLQIVLPLGGGLLGALVALWLMGGFVSGTPKPQMVEISLTSNFFGGGIGCVVGTYTWLALRAGQLRPYLRRVIEEYEGEASR